MLALVTTIRRTFVIGLGAVSLLGAVACRLEADSRQPDQAAPTFSLADQDGNTVSLAQLTGQGHAVLVFYRGHW